MKSIGGNVTASFMALEVTTNSIGEDAQDWYQIATHKGFLDYAKGEESYPSAKVYKSYKHKSVASTHIFICDVFDIEKSLIERLVIDSVPYDVLYFDEPMGLGDGYHFEIYLRRLDQ